jgi:CheY-like chemotaxis protein
MSHPEEFSIFGKKSKSKPAADAAAKDTARAESKPDVPQAPAAAPAAEPEVIQIDNLTAEQLEAFFPSEKPESKEAVAAADPTSAVANSTATLPSCAEASQAKPQSERRTKRRASISAPVRVRSIDLTHNGLDDITTTLNVSRIGILLASCSPVYYRSMDVMVTFPHSKAPNSIQAEQPGRVVRVSELPDGRRSIAIALGVTHRDEEFISSSGQKLLSGQEAPKFTFERDPNSVKPLVLALDAESSIRESMKSYLSAEGYDVITVTNASEARDVLSQCTPSLLIAEIEGEGMPGYDICSHCKATPRLQSMPVMLTTSSAYPSDYASAHSLGAVVCMAKPYRQDRLGHVVRLLAPPPNANENAAPPRPADPSRRTLGASQTQKAPSSSVNRRFRFGRKS